MRLNSYLRPLLNSICTSSSRGKVLRCGPGERELRCRNWNSGAAVDAAPPRWELTRNGE